MVKCTDCGYLAFRHKDTRNLTEAEQEFRDTGELTRDLNRRYVYDIFPICFKLAANFRKEVPQMTEENLFSVLNEDRECACFIKWQQGFSPREHEEMIQQRAMLEWQREREEEERKWRDEHAAREHKWRQEDGQFSKRLQALEETRHQEVRRDTWLQHYQLVWIPAVLSAIAILVSLWTAYRQQMM